MSEPTTAVKGVAIGAAVVGILPTVDNSVIVASVCGAAIFLLYTNDQSTKRNVLAFLISIACGIMLSDFTANLINHFLPDTVQISENGGALISSAISVGAIGFLIKATKNPIKTYKEMTSKEDQGGEDENKSS